MLKIGKRIVFLFLLLNIQMVAALAAEPSTATLAVASNFLAPAKALAEEFNARTGNRIQISAGSTGKLYAQIINGAPFDAFFAANEREPKRLEQEQFAVQGSRFTYARGQLVLWSTDKTLLNDFNAEKFKEIKIDSLSIANPRTAPYGAAATTIIDTNFGKRPPFRVIRGENVGQAYQYVRSGNTQAGFVALSQVKAGQVDVTGSYWIVPEDEYAPIEQQAVLLKRGQSNPAALAFIEFVKSKQVRKQLSTIYGYAPMTELAALSVKDK